MKSISLIRIAGRSILRNKLRTLLTMLGIVIGVCCIILIISFGQGLQKVFMEEVEALGSNLLVVIPGKKEVSKAGGPGGRSIRFRGPTINSMRAEDAELIAETCPAVTAACPSIELSAKVTYMNEEYDGRLEGTHPASLPGQRRRSRSPSNRHPMSSSGTAGTNSGPRERVGARRCTGHRKCLRNRGYRGR